MNMKLTKKQILELHSALLSVGNLKGVRFSYAVAKNLSSLATEVIALQKAYTTSKEFNEYDNERIKLAEKHAERVNGRPDLIITKDGLEKYNIKDEPKFFAELKILQSKHETAIKNREDQLKEIDKILEEQVDIDLCKISINDIPEEIQAKQMADLFMIVEDDKKKITN